jgi:vacuolar-type H+-ATPase subunit F/Vma7
VTDTGLLVVVPAELEAGFRLAGVETVSVQTEDEGVAALREIMSTGRAGLIAVHEPFLSSLAVSEREMVESSLSPVVMPLPAALERHDEGKHQARIAAMLSRAVGYHTTFKGSAGEGGG